MADVSDYLKDRPTGFGKIPVKQLGGLALDVSRAGGSKNIAGGVVMGSWMAVNNSQCDVFEKTATFSAIKIEGQWSNLLVGIQKVDLFGLFATYSRLYAVVERDNIHDREMYTSFSVYPKFIMCAPRDIPSSGFELMEHHLTSWSALMCALLIGLPSSAIEFEGAAFTGGRLPRLYNLGGGARSSGDIYVSTAHYASLAKVIGARLAARPGVYPLQAVRAADKNAVSGSANTAIGWFMSNVKGLTLESDVEYIAMLLATFSSAYYKIKVLDQFGNLVYSFPASFGTRVSNDLNLRIVAKVCSVPLFPPDAEVKAANMDFKLRAVTFWRTRESDLLYYFLFGALPNNPNFVYNVIPTERPEWRLIVASEGINGVRFSHFSMVNHLMPLVPSYSKIERVDFKTNLLNTIRYLEFSQITKAEQYIDLIAWGNVIGQIFTRSANDRICVGNFTFGTVGGLGRLVMPFLAYADYYTFLSTGKIPAAAPAGRIYINLFCNVQLIASTFGRPIQVILGSGAVEEIPRLFVSSWSASAGKHWYNAFIAWGSKDFHIPGRDNKDNKKE